MPQLIAFIGSGYLFKVLAALADLPFIWLRDGCVAGLTCRCKTARTRQSG